MRRRHSLQFRSRKEKNETKLVLLVDALLIKSLLILILIDSICVGYVLLVVPGPYVRGFDTTIQKVKYRYVGQRIFVGCTVRTNRYVFEFYKICPSVA